MNISGERTQRLVAICKSLNAKKYISGPSAKGYIRPEEFSIAGMELEFQEYNYPEYKQLFPPFDHNVSIIDLLFNCGPNSPEYIWGKYTKNQNQL